MHCTTQPLFTTKFYVSPEVARVGDSGGGSAASAKRKDCLKKFNLFSTFLHKKRDSLFYALKISHQTKASVKDKSSDMIRRK